MSKTLHVLGVVVLLCATTDARASGQPSPKAAMLEQAGWAALDAGQVQAAADAFRDALALDAKNPRLHLGAGVAAFLQRRDADAKSALDQALLLNPKLTRARVVLGQVLRRGGDLQGAINAYEIVVAEAPGDQAARDTLERWRRELELHERMRLAVGDHFTVSFEGPEDAELASRALESLDRAFWRICGVLGTYPTASVPVILYTGEQFRDITRSPPWAGGVYDGKIRVPMRGAFTNLRELDRVLAHEFVHALVRNLAGGAVPTWLNEGLASALEGDDLSWAEGPIRKTREVPSLRALQTSFGRLTGDQAHLAYATSALAARRLIDEAGGVAMVNLLRDLGSGVEFETAFEHRMQRSFAEFQALLERP